MRRRGPGQRRHQPLAAVDEILQVFADRLRVAQFVMLVQQRLEQRFVRRAPHEAELQRSQVGQSGFQRCGIDEHHRCSAMPTDAIGVARARWRQFDATFPVQTQQQAAADGVLEHAVGLSPVPRLTDLLRQRSAAQGRLIREQLPQEGHVVVRDRASAIGEQRGSCASRYEVRAKNARGIARFLGRRTSGEPAPAARPARPPRHPRCHRPARHAVDGLPGSERPARRRPATRRSVPGKDASGRA